MSKDVTRSYDSTHVQVFVVIFNPEGEPAALVQTTSFSWKSTFCSWCPALTNPLDLIATPEAMGVDILRAHLWSKRFFLYFSPFRRKTVGTTKKRKKTSGI